MVNAAPSSPFPAAKTLVGCQTLLWETSQLVLPVANVDEKGKMRDSGVAFEHPEATW